MCTYFCIAFTLLVFLPITSPFTLMPALPPRQDLFFPAVLYFCRRKRKHKKKNMTF
jgi:hypothetical protein